MVKIVNGSLLESEADIIAHQVNCSGVFNSGVAKSICEHDYGVYRDYLEFCKERTPSSLSGTVRYFQSNIDAKMYASLFTQDTYRYGAQCTDIRALEKCFMDLRQYIDLYEEMYHKKLSIAMPYKSGWTCDVIGWGEVLELINKVFGDYEVELCRLNKG